ncbi:unnamed protein product [Paramecium sonneborni]|uniref:Protein kinase domain-containing protein n=1 Tax=Paramecium sonneborni TaxID=65129 RepID=A0A8S1RR18_9CILI|nr:unnamed protein product [Paramecium sonneborni]
MVSMWLQNGKRKQVNMKKTILQSLKEKRNHIIQVFAYKEKKCVFLVMELGDTTNLKMLPDKRKTCLEMAKGVFELHQLRFFHRDLKPNNFVVRKDEKIKLIDFGIAKTIAEEFQTQGKGKYVYMAPEVYFKNVYDDIL